MLLAAPSPEKVAERGEGGGGGDDSDTLFFSDFIVLAKIIIMWYRGIIISNMTDL